MTINSLGSVSYNKYVYTGRKNNNNSSFASKSKILDNCNKFTDAKIKNQSYLDFDKDLIDRKKETDKVDDELNYDNVKSEELENQKSEFKIINKPDGSKLLMLTTSIGGMKMTFSIKISGPGLLGKDTEQKQLSKNDADKNCLSDLDISDKENEILNNIINEK